jgi:hypothetical protein
MNLDQVVDIIDDFSCRSLSGDNVYYNSRYFDNLLLHDLTTIVVAILSKYLPLYCFIFTSL